MEGDKQFSNIVIKFSNQVEDIIAWLFCKEEELQKRSNEANLKEASTNQVLDEYSYHEKFLTEISEYCHTIIKCKEEGQDIRDNDENITDEDRDEIGIQMDAMLVLYDKLKILTTDRLHNLQRIVDEKQRSNIDWFEKSLTSIETKLSALDIVGPDYESLQRQIGDVDKLKSELEQKQEDLDVVSRLILFEDIEVGSTQIKSPSCEKLVDRLDDMNKRWTTICRSVDYLDTRLQKADAIWTLLRSEGPKLANRMGEVLRKLNELEGGAKYIMADQKDEAFLNKLLSRSKKIDSEIKGIQSPYTSLEDRVRREIEKFDDPCSMFVIELEKELEDMQNNWNHVMRQKRVIDYKLQALSNTGSTPEDNAGPIIPVPEPITRVSDSDLRFDETDDILPNKGRLIQDTYNEIMTNSSSTGHDELNSSPQLNGSLSDARSFENLKDILADIEIRYNSVERCLLERKSKDTNNLTLHQDQLEHLEEEESKELEESLESDDPEYIYNLQLQQIIQELATKLQISEILKSNWVSLENLSIEQLSEQLEDLKLYRERLIEVESVHKELHSLVDSMEQYGATLSHLDQKRIDDLNNIWDSLQSRVEERQKSIEYAFDEQSSSEQKFLTQTVSDLPNWERRVATSKVPYFIDHKTNETHWDHPKFTKVLEKMNESKQYVFTAYRTAMKIRTLQKSLGIDKLMLEQLKELLSRFDPMVSKDSGAIIGVEQVVLLLKSTYDQLQSTESPQLDVPVAIDLTLNWLLNLFDATRTGHLSVMSLKVGLALICCATREEKYTFMFELISDRDTGTADAKKLGTLFEICTRIPAYLGESESFGGSGLIETSIRDCLAMSKFNPQHPNCVNLHDYLNWLKTEPQFIIWLPVLHKLLVSENTTHRKKCKLCGSNPIVGLRYRCLKCFKFNICQKCFMTGRHVYEHHDPVKHPLREYCCPSNLGDQLSDFMKIVRSTFK